MPVELGLWRLHESGATLVAPQKLPLEKQLEAMLEGDIKIVRPDLLLIGRQVPTAHGTYIDLLGINQSGDLVVLELKRDKTPRDVIGQLLDYGSWLSGLDYSDVAQVFQAYRKLTLESAFADRFGAELPDSINTRQELVLVASDLDASSERIVSYLATLGVSINVLFFRYFVDEDREYLGRSWLLEAAPSAGTGSAPKKQPPWDGRTFYVTVGEEGGHRSWDDWRRYGFVSAGGGSFWTKPLNNLFPGSRVFAYLPAAGYVGVGEVVERLFPSLSS